MSRRSIADYATISVISRLRLAPHLACLRGSSSLLGTYRDITLNPLFISPLQTRSYHSETEESFYPFIRYLYDTEFLKVCHILQDILQVSVQNFARSYTEESKYMVSKFLTYAF
jgi:hypothetical protein